jgi:hypothetical protein
MTRVRPAATEPARAVRRLAAMQTTRRFAGLLILVALVAACAGSATSAPPSTAPTIDPNTPVTDAPGNGGGGVSGDGGGLVEPKPGQLDVHPVAMDLLEAAVDGRHVVVTTSWTSGVEPCYTLDSVVVDKGDHAFTLTIREGHGPEDVACIEIAQMKSAKVDLGDLEPGTYTISDSQGGAAPIEVVVR